GAVALGLAAGAPALDERAGEHLAQSAETADETTAQLQLRVAGHKDLLSTDISNTVRKGRGQDLFEICKNELQGENKGKLPEIKRLALPRPHRLRNRCHRGVATRVAPRGLGAPHERGQH